MTTEHVSVPRELAALIDPLESVKIADGETDFVVMIGARQAIKIREALRNCMAIISRAAPSDDVAKLQSQIDVLTRTMGLAEQRHAQEIRLASAPRVVTDEDDLVRQLRGRAEFLRDMGRIKSPQLMEQAANVIESFATSLPAARVPRVVYMCSNPKCCAVYAKDPMGHCPTCIQPNGVGFSTMRKDVL